MGVYAGPDVSESGLVLALDGANFKSFKGEVTTNLIPSPTVNAYPTTGNGWGTYNVNQYNSNTYFSIGTINDVTNNIVTTTTAHPLRTYDVVTPQTTGGGVTAGTNYFVKKISNTSFSLHAYNSSQDGSQGYISSTTGTHKVYDSIANDTRISINSTSFPTMWWGPPHLPNSGLVKELRYGEFNAIPNLPANDCIRLHYIRTDDVKDGMSYGVDCTVTPSSPVTVSFYTRSANANAVGKQIQYEIYNYSGGSPTGYYHNFTLGQVGVWERQTFTFTPANSIIISYWFPQSSGVYAWDWSCMQVEQKSYVTNFVAGTRGSTVATGGGWADMSGNGNNGELANGVRESSNNLGALVFDGTNDYIQLSSNSNLTFAGDFTCSIWLWTDVQPSSNTIWSLPNGQTFQFTTHNSQQQIVYYSNVTGVQAFGNLPNNTWRHYIITKSGNTITGYANGIQIWTTTPGSSETHNFSGSSIGYRTISPAGFYWDGNIAQVSIYNRALTASEIQQNFNANRSRFGI